MTKVLIWADLQLHTWEQFGISKGNMSRRMLEQQSILEQIKKINKERRIDFNIFGGDWVQIVGDHPTEVVMMTIKYFQEDRTPYLFADGNHDLEDTVSPTWYQNIANMLRVLAAATPKNQFGLQIRTVHYQDKVDYDELKGYDIVVLHKQPEMLNDFGHKMKGVDWQKIAKNNKLVFFGHDHTRKQLADNCWVIGAPMHHTFGDKGDRGAYLVEFDGDKKPKVEFIKLQYPEFLTVETEAEVKQDGNYYTVLNASENYREDNVIGVHKAPVFEQRIKAEAFRDILIEWCKINGKDETYMLMIDDIIKDKVQSVKDLFKGRVDSVEVKDFMSIEHAAYKLEDGVTFIAGLNGVGKSTATGEAIYWCLFGKTTKELTGDDVIRDDCKDCSVVVRLKGDTSYEVIRSRKNGLEVLDRKTKKDLAEGLRADDRQEVLERVLGFNEAVFKAACYFSQENLMMLTGLTDGDRTNMITDLLGFETYDDLYERTHIKQKNFEKERQQIEESKIPINADIQVLESKIVDNRKNTDSIIKEIDDTKLDTMMYRDRITELKAALRGLARCVPAEEETAAYDKSIKEKESLRDTIKESIEEVAKGIEAKGYDKTINELTAKEAKLNAEIKELSNNESRLNEEILDPIASVDPKYSKEIAEIRGEIGRLTGQREAKATIAEALVVEIGSLGKLEKNVKCDKCGAFITAENVQKFIDEKKAKIETAKKESAEIAAQITAKWARIDALEKAKNDELEDGKKKYIAERKYKIGDIQEKRVEMSKEAKAIAVQVGTVGGELAAALEEKKLFEKKLNKIEQEIQTTRTARDVHIKRATEQVQEKISKENAIANCENMISINDRTISTNDLKIENLKKERKELQAQYGEKEKQLKDSDIKISKIGVGIDIMEFWKAAFSAKGIRSVLLDNFCNEFNNVVNPYLATVTNGMMSIVISPTASTKKGEERNKIGMVIKKGTRERTYKQLSGGQKKRVDVALCFGLNKWVSNKYGVPKGMLGLIVLDELFSFIDRIGEESIANLIYNEARDKAIIEISHTPELKSYCDRVWKVVMENDIGRLEV